MNSMYFLLIIILFTFLVLILTHIRPLTEDEVRDLAKKRRDKEIRAYYTFTRDEFTADKDFKKRMNKAGAFYSVSEYLHSFPSVAAALLKGKKHEWIIVAFEKDKKIELMWLNKGFNNSGGALYLSTDSIVETSAAKGYQSILRFHNHPNPDPKRFTCTMPSVLDIKTAAEFSGNLNSKGVNFVDFVCERGRHYEYCLSPAESFNPLGNYLSELNEVNGMSIGDNLGLHYERIFK